MRCDLSCRGPIGVQQPGGGTVRGVALVALQRPLDGSADDRMDEARRVGGGQHLPAHEAGGQRHRRGRLHGSDRSRVAQRASVSEDGQRLRQAEGVRIEAAHARHHPSRDLLDARRQEHGGVDRGRSRVVGCDRPQQLGQVKGIAAACRPDRRAELIVGPPAGRRPHDRGGGGLAQQRGVHDHRCLGPQRRQRRAGRRRLVGAQRDQQRQLQPLQPRREVGQPPQRGLVCPVRVIDGDQHRSSGRKVGGEPVQAVQDGKRRVVGRRRCRLAEQQRPHRGSGSGEQCFALWGFGAREPPLEQLAHDAEGEVRLELRPAGSQDLVATLLRLPAGRVDQRRLPDTRPTLDQEHLAAAFQQRVNRRELAFALDQLVHRTTLDPRRRAGARLPDGRPALPVAKDGEQGGASAPVRGWCAGGRTPCRRRWRCSRRRRSCRPRRARDPGRTRPGRRSRP